MKVTFAEEDAKAAAEVTSTSSRADLLHGLGESSGSYPVATGNYGAVLPAGGAAPSGPSTPPRNTRGYGQLHTPTTAPSTGCSPGLSDTTSDTATSTAASTPVAPLASRPGGWARPSWLLSQGGSERGIAVSPVMSRPVQEEEEHSTSFAADGLGRSTSTFL